MANLFIERKRATVWPWIVALIIIALIIWFFATSGHQRRPATAVPAGTHTSQTTPAARPGAA